jgi:hypothetical protein
LTAKPGWPTPGPAPQARGTIISVFDDPQGIARFLLNGLPVGERQHVIDVIHRHERRDLQRLQAQGDQLPATVVDAVISLPDTVKVPSLPATPAAA